MNKNSPPVIGRTILIEEDIILKKKIVLTMLLSVIFSILPVNVISATTSTGIEVELEDYSDDFENAIDNADGSGEFAEKDTKSIESGVNKVIKRVKLLAVFLLAMITITLIIWLIIQLSTLGGVGDNPKDRKSKLSTIGLTFLGIAIMGGFTVLFALAFNVFR